MQDLNNQGAIIFGMQDLNNQKVIIYAIDAIERIAAMFFQKTKLAEEVEALKLEVRTLAIKVERKG